MRESDDLRARLLEIEGRGYKAYKAIAGQYRYPHFVLAIDHVQGDPFADPSRMRALVPPETTSFPADLLENETRRIALADFLNRIFADSLRRHSGRRGSGKSGELRILRPGQVVLRRSSAHVQADGSVEMRFRAGLPARGRTALGKEAAEMLDRDAPAAVAQALRFDALAAEAVRAHVHAVEDAQALRGQLEAHGLISFVADGSILPRRSGVDDRPLEGESVVPFDSPASLRVTLEAPHAGQLTGLGIRRGITLLVGGGFHGKSTLLRAIERGVYDHAAGDGRERVVTVRDAVKVRAEDGRSVASTDISNFIDALPGGIQTRGFSTANASGSTSQAAGIAEALEIGTTALLLDEDTSATNFLIRDARVQALVAKEEEPITPLIDRARLIHDHHGVSLIVVVGGSGDYFEIADTVIAMRAYRPRDATGEAHALVERYPTRRASEGRDWRPPTVRRPDPGSIDPGRGRRERSIKAFGRRELQFGEERVDTSAIEQLVEEAQLRAIGRAIAWGRSECMDEDADMAEAMRCIAGAVERKGLDLLEDYLVGDMAEFRPHELAAVLNRLRTLRCR